MKDVILTCLVETKQGEEVHAHSLFVFTRELHFPASQIHRLTFYQLYS